MTDEKDEADAGELAPGTDAAIDTAAGVVAAEGVAADAVNESPFVVDRNTPIGDMPPLYRHELVAALEVLTAALEKTKKNVTKVRGHTEEYDERLEIVENLKGCLGARADSSFNNTPMGRAMKDGAAKHARSAQSDLSGDELEPMGVDLTDIRVVAMMLEIIDYIPTPAEIDRVCEKWSTDQRRDVYRWARAVQLVQAGSAEFVRVPARPATVTGDWLKLEVRVDVELGRRDPETLRLLDQDTESAILDEEISAGPWAPMAGKGSLPLVSGEEGDEPWTLRYNAPEGDAGQRPFYDFTHRGEKAARRVAAELNMLIADGMLVENPAALASDAQPAESDKPKRKGPRKALFHKPADGKKRAAKKRR